MKHPDGSIISQYFDVQDKPPSGDDMSNQGLRFAVGQVEKIHYVDDQSNVSKIYVEYNVSTRDAKGGQSTFRNVRKLDTLGGANDYDELILEANEFAYKGKLETSNTFKNKNGTTVLLGFIDGSQDKPVILMGLQHPTRKGAKRADGVRRKGEFRGVQWEINKDGEMIITHQGLRGADGKLKTSDTVNTVVKFDKAGNLTITDKATNQVRWSNTDVKLELQSDSKGTKVTLDGKNDVVTTSTAGGLTSVHDGKNDKLTVTTAGGATVTINGAGDDILLKTADGAELHLSTGKVALGQGSVEILDKLSKVADLLAQWATNVGAVHSHIDSLGYAVGAPDNFVQWVQLGTDEDAVKTDVDSIKGTLT